MSKHTPGPWEIHEENTIVGPKLDDKAIWLRPIVLQSKTGIKPADARLIAAAPDLLEALEASLEEMKDDWVTLDGEFGPFMQEFGDIESAIKEEHASTKTIRMAIAAIAKAKGEA